MTRQRKAVLTGGTGFLGGVLARGLVREGWRVTIVGRQRGADVPWDGRTLSAWSDELEGADAVINLAGRSVACLYTEENRRVILQSRVDSTRVVGEALRRAKRPPPVWLQAASLAIYGSPGDEICDERTPASGSAEMGVTVCKAWEQALGDGVCPSRRIALRIGIVLGRGAGGLQPLERLTRVFLGGAAGSGRQWISWIHEEDFVRACLWLIDRPGAEGAYNVCAPDPAQITGFMRALRRALHRPWAPPAPAWLVRAAATWLLRTDPSLALSGRRCVPARLVAEGFAFRYPELQGALGALYQKNV